MESQELVSATTSASPTNRSSPTNRRARFAMERQPSYTSEESSPFASVPTASGNAVRSLLNENTTAADSFAVTLLGQEGVSKKLRTEDDAVTRTVKARQDTVRAAFNSGTMSPQDLSLIHI